MKKLKLFIIATFMCMLFLGVSSSDVKADTKIYKGKNYYIDIDSKAGKEKICVKEYPTKYEDFSYYTLYINDKKVKTVGDGYSYRCYIIDIQKNKKGKEIVFAGVGPSNGISGSFGIYKYERGRFSRIGSNKYGYFRFARVPSVKTDGKGNVYIVGDTPIELGVGCYYGKVDLKLKNGKLKPVKYKEIKFSATSKKQKYVIGKSTDLLKKASYNSERTRTLYYGDSLRIMKLKFGDLYKKDYTTKQYSADTVFAYVKTSSGKKGWIEIEPYDYDSYFNQFQEYYLWG